MCDTVHVEFPKLNVSAKAKCIKTTYDVLAGKYISIELGEAKPSLVSNISSQNQTVNKLPQSVEKNVEDTLKSTNVVAKNMKVDMNNVVNLGSMQEANMIHKLVQLEVTRVIGSITEDIKEIKEHIGMSV